MTEILVIRYVKYVRNTLIVSIETCKKLPQLVSTSYKRPSSGEMKNWPEEGWFYSGEGLDIFGDQRWTVKINIHTSNGSWLICDQCHVRCEEGLFNETALAMAAVYQKGGQ